jgi:hypothetical protein
MELALNSVICEWRLVANFAVAVFGDVSSNMHPEPL